MSITWELFERWKATRDNLSLRDAAKELGVSHTAITFWRDGRNGSASVIERLCKDLGDDFGLRLAEAWAEGARSTADKRALQRLAKRFRGAGLAALVAALPLSLPTAANAHSSQTSYSLCEHRNAQRGRMFNRRLPMVRDPRRRAPQWKRPHHVCRLSA